MENIQNTQFGKMYREHFQAIKGETSTLSSKRSAPSVTMPYQSLNLMTKSEQSLFGTKQESCGKLLHRMEEHLTRNTGECPNVARESTLSQILQADAPEKYYLSPKACEGICREGNEAGQGSCR